MEKFWEKFDQYLFDIVGIILPGFLAILIFCFLSGVELQSLFISTKIQSLLVPGKAQSLKAHSVALLYPDFNFQNAVVLFILFLCSALFGHTVKYFGVTFYETFGKWLDGGLYKHLRRFLHKVNRKIKNFQRRWIRGFLRRGGLWRWCLCKLYCLGYRSICWVLKPVWGIIKDDLLRFQTKKYASNYKPIEKYVVHKLSNDQNLQGLRVSDPTKFNNEIYKIADILSRNKNNGIKSLWYMHLAKYNCYRSLAFLFLATFLICLASHTSFIGGLHLVNANETVCIFSLILFITFHYKFKRYWQLCSAEALMTLFYYYYDRP
jgi:hypothetical protein